MAFIHKEKSFSKKWLINYALIIVGAFIMAAGFVLFVTPYKIVPGGVYGISIVLHHMFDTPVGLIALCFDIPLTIIGVRVLGPRFWLENRGWFFCNSYFCGWFDLFLWRSSFG